MQSKVLLNKSGGELLSTFLPEMSACGVVSALKKIKFSRLIICLPIDYFLTANIPIILFSGVLNI